MTIEGKPVATSRLDRWPGDFLLEDLAPMVLPPELGLERDCILPVEDRPAQIRTTYDYSTLAYGAAWVPRRRGIVLMCPKLLNFERLVRQGEFHSEARRHRLRRVVRRERYDEVWLEADKAPEWIALRANGVEMRCPVRTPLAALIGRRVLITVSRDNRLEWIADWTAHCVRHQGAEAVLIYDNGSETYAPEAILDVLATVPGLTAAVIISAPLPYGAISLKRSSRALFLQTALLNLARLGPLASARSVLQCDVDELPVSRGRTLFEAAESAFTGFVTADCCWRIATQEKEHPRFGDHVLRHDPELLTKQKYAICSDGLLGNLPWNVHGIGRNQYNRLCKSSDHVFYHCESIGTDWKRRRGKGLKRPGEIVSDAATAADMRRLGLRS